MHRYVLVCAVCWLVAGGAFAQDSPKDAEAAAGETPALRLLPGPPPGFEDLGGTQTTAADVYFGGELITTAFVEYDLAQVTILDPLSITEAIPNARDPTWLATQLAGPRNNNASALCHARKRTDCGRLSPAVVDIIFDEGRFRLDVFVAQHELLMHTLEREKYLPAPVASRASLHNVRFNLGGSGGERRFNIASESFISQERSRLHARYGVSDERASLYELSWQRDGRDVEYEVGSFRAPGGNMAFSNDLDVLGLRIASSTKSRVDLDHALATPLYLFLGDRSRVDVYRGSELLNSRYYDAGNQQIDTREFPDGAYTLTLRVTDSGGSTREEQHFFVRNMNMPPMHEPQYYIEMGQVVDTQRTGVPKFVEAAWVRAGGSVRLRDNAAVDHEMVYAGRKGLLQGGLMWVEPAWQVYSGLMYSTAGDVGYSLRGSYQHRDISAHLDFRRVDASGGDVALGEFDLIRGSYTQATATVAMPLGSGRLLLRGRINERRGVRDDGVGFSYWASALRRGRFSADLSLDGFYTEGASWIRAGVTLRWRRGADSALVKPRLEYAQQEHASWQGRAFMDARWNAAGELPGMGRVDRSYYASHDPARSAIGARLVPEDFPDSDFEVGYQRRNARGEFFYALNNSMSVVTKHGRTVVSPGNGRGGETAAAVVVNISGNTFGKFDVVVNGRVAGVAWAHQQNVISLRPYETYRIRIRPSGDGIVGFDESVHTVTLYPGNVATLSFTARDLTVLVGQAIFPDGAPVARAKFENVEGYGATDLNGWFQVEVYEHTPLELVTRGGESCWLTLPDVRVDDSLLVLDTLVCEPATPGPP